VSLNSVSCASAGNCTAVGGDLLFTEEAGQWAPGVDASSILDDASVGIPVSNLTSVSCASDGSCSAVGYDEIYGRDLDGFGLGVLLTKTEGKLRRIVTVMPDDGPGEGVALLTVSCIPGGNCSAFGLYNVGIDSEGGGHGVLLSEKAGKWQPGVMAMP